MVVLRPLKRCAKCGETKPATGEYYLLRSDRRQLCRSVCKGCVLKGDRRVASLSVRFWKKVIKHKGCWQWTAAKTEHGYGVIRHKGHNLKASRVAWELHHGPTELCVLHKCDNPECCNPEHLFLGTQLENIADMHAKRRGANPPVKRGSDNFKARLSAESVRSIRNRYAAGETGPRLASEHGISLQSIMRAVHRQTWKHVA